MSWTKFERAYYNTEQLNDIARHVLSLGIPKHLATEFMKEFTESLVFKNNKYQVDVTYEDNMAHLSIKRLDKEPCRDWRDFQRIKNELCGTSCEAVEVYPNKDRTLDTSNQYHLWCFQPNTQLPFGFTQRKIFDSKDLEKQQGNLNAKQRPLEQHHIDTDCPKVGPVWKDYKG